MASINPAIKTIVFLIVGLMLSFNQRWEVNIFILVLCFVFLLFSSHKKSWIFIFGSALLIAGSLFFTSLYFGQGASSGNNLDFITALTHANTLSSATSLATRILAFASLGLLFSFTTNPDQLVASYIQQFHLPLNYAYGILAAFHFMDNIKQEYRQVQLAFLVRNNHVHPFSMKPLSIMLINALHWSGEIASAMQSKGFDCTHPRTTYLVIKIKAVDYIFLITSIFIILLILWGCIS